MNARGIESKTFPVEYKAELLRIAKGDLESAKSLRHASGRKENVVYLAQQAVEKALKAKLCGMGKPVPFVHDVGLLVGQLSASGEIPPYGALLTDLTPFATTRRYQEGVAELTDEDLDGSLKMAEEVIEWVKNR